MTTAIKQPSYKAEINVSEDVRKRLIELLNARLADSLDLSTHAKQAHWNVKGIDFYKLDLLVFFLEKAAEHADRHVEMIAERVTALGGIASGTARLAAKNSSLPEYNLNAVTCEEHLKALSQSLAAYGKLIREAVNEANRLGDKGTVDLFAQIIRRANQDLEIARRADQDLYFLEIHLDA